MYPSKTTFFSTNHMLKPITSGQFLGPVTPGGRVYITPSKLKTTNAIDMIHSVKVDNYKKVQFEMFLGIFLLLYGSYVVLKFLAVISGSQ